ncbi:hypothetical protein HYPSUDRAFT_208837 [Hypholoma sublateritium FD-334 SS-4]|uniref:WW domain-containing protein n=1 Tax=Hypholoma sublateritium (strain FD-334 SS-4) TaxID=945553 RepID=A0A0D2P0W8_HYPSF|nr:hypothetical protein HYPSUDRAFT_208837 [Hypholoma sublateritium FD-334 SS-4]
MQYNPPAGGNTITNSNRAPLARGWRQHQHPNGDIYFHNDSLCLTTSDNVRDAATLHYILDARADHIACLADDPHAHRLPRDIELVVSEVTRHTAVIRMYSRSAHTAYRYADRTGLRVAPPEEFWTHIAEFPSHHRALPPGAEAAFVAAVQRAQTAVNAGAQYCFSERTIGQIVERYRELVLLREQGRDVVAPLAWLVGVVMPLEPVGREAGGVNIDHILHADWR